MTKKAIIDRFEGDFAIIELQNRKMVSVPREILPECAKEGDVILISVDDKETQKRNESIRNLFESLKEESEG